MDAGIWLAIALVLVLAEIISFNFVFASFAIGSLAASIVAITPLTGSTAIASEVLVFALSSVASLKLMRPTVLQVLYRRSDDARTGTEKLIGRLALTTSIVSDASGSIVIDGETWSARTATGQIASGSQVTVIAITGAIAQVEVRN